MHTAMFISKKSINTTHPICRINPVVVNPQPIEPAVIVPERKKGKDKVVKEEKEEPVAVTDNQEQK